MNHHSPEQSETDNDRIQEKKQTNLLRRFKAVQDFVTKHCFGGKVDDTVKNEADEAMHALSHALGVASSNLDVDLSGDPDQLTLKCLEDPAVQAATLRVEQIVLNVHGRMNGARTFESLGLKAESLSA
jgi:hypothetical protein